jgi:hypothetical protein
VLAALSLPEIRWAALATALFAVGAVAQLAGAPEVVWWSLYLACYAAGGWEPALAGLQALREKTLDVDLLMIVAALVAASIGRGAQLLEGVRRLVHGYVECHGEVADAKLVDADQAEKHPDTDRVGEQAEEPTEPFAFNARQHPSPSLFNARSVHRMCVCTRCHIRTFARSYNYCNAAAFVCAVILAASPAITNGLAPLSG